MTDPIRLLDATSSPALAAVLRSAAEDVPADPEGGRKRIYAAAASLAAGAGAATSPWMRRAPWLLLAAAIAFGSAGAWWSSSDDGSSPVSARSPRTVDAARVTMAAAASPVTSMRVDDLPTASAPVVTGTSLPPKASVAASDVARPDELTMIDAVRSSLAAGQPSEALDRLAAYRRVYPHGALDVEADVLEVQALSGVGRTEDARAKAREFLDTHPGSPYEKRIRAVAKL